MNKLTREERRAQRKEYMEKRLEIKKKYDEKHYYQHKELYDQIRALDEQYPFRKRNKRRPDRDMQQYYRHLRIVRPLPIFLIIILWAMVYFSSGLTSSIGVIILIFAIMVTVGSIFQLIFTYRLEKRVLKPIDSLRRGMREIAAGNYDVKVSPGIHHYLDTLIDDFNAMAQKLKEAEALKAEYENNRKDLIANISHDLKTPITSIQGYIEALAEQEGMPDEKVQNYLKIIHGNVLYMNRLIDDLFLFAKLDMQKLGFDWTEVSARPFMRDLMEELGLELEEKGVFFSYADKLNGDARLRIDTKRFHQVLKNLLDNAVKYGPKTGLVIRAQTEGQPGFLRVSLTDNGPGIPEDQIKDIFKRFYRLDAQRTKDTASTGLGLAIAKELVEMMGGNISAENAQGGGTRFIVALPVLNATEEKNETHSDH